MVCGYVAFFLPPWNDSSFFIIYYFYYIYFILFVSLTKNAILYKVGTKPLVALRFLLLKKRKLKNCVLERMNDKYSEKKNYIFKVFFSLYICHSCSPTSMRFNLCFCTLVEEKHITFTENIFHKLCASGDTK